MVRQLGGGYGIIGQLNRRYRVRLQMNRADNGFPEMSRVDRARSNMAAMNGKGLQVLWADRILLNQLRSNCLLSKL